MMRHALSHNWTLNNKAHLTLSVGIWTDLMNHISTNLSGHLAEISLYRPVPAKTLSASVMSWPKRLFDLVAAGLGLVFLAPFLLTIAILIKMTSPGPVIFAQTRTGLGGKAFKIYKFRTMTTLEDGDCVIQACRNDQRITALGNFLRRSSLDELPQLWNVLRGEMSIVGPRPHAVAHDHYYGALLSDYRERFRAKPGITGLAQCSGSRGPTETLDKMRRRIRLDLDYIENWSLGMEMRILFKTAKLVIMGDSCAF
ncbi:UDP-glucose:undecaprenyl-phosphate glucose-1-phosphate transferase [Candidatus Phycosocius bacilliformis]|uniref:UDP-glucose:undecaprenyl-phosphate glucose-1-phosphate transferase n=1 Tax=Candidatus Phycosocius bacilliformis TaxID=1445552 RepID=A0A2P2E638_9PROT|nr:exopolysaccharide biosynthesis polyprenyl glycosylphosphotransferase [Candidatus Phycosocius bacilliformis]GBF56521.1 UDP-glucose:undecaprenyl-phosphate glucose-1-phosphate transferase [Candidatus Phycosocius bacilliformis]